MCKDDQAGFPATVLWETGHPAEAAHPVYGSRPVWVDVCPFISDFSLCQLSSNSVCLVIFFQRSPPDCFPCCGLRASSMSLIRKYSFQIVILAGSKHLINWVFCLFNDRYFNYRTTRFLAEEGFYKFHNWFDDRAWYPLGRIIGGTIYPGTAEGHSFQKIFICVFQPLADPLWSWAKYQIPECFSHAATMSLYLIFIYLLPLKILFTIERKPHY